MKERSTVRLGKVWITFFSLLLTLELIPLSAQTIPEGPSFDPTKNAALYYWQAFQFFQSGSKDFQYELHDVLFQAEQGNFDPKMKEVLEAAEPYVKLLKMGLQQPYCDWGKWHLEVHITPPNVLSSRRMSRLLSASVKYNMHEGITDTALEHFKTGIRFTKDISQGKLLIAEFVEFSELARMIRAGTELLPSLERSRLNHLARFTDEQLLPPSSRIPEAFRNDLHLLLEHLRANLEEAETADQLLERIERRHPRPAAQFQQLSSIEEIRDLMDMTETQVQKLVPLLELQDPRKFENEWRQFNEANELSPIIASSGDIQTVFLQKQAAELYPLAFRAGLAVLLHGRNALNEYPEPGFNKPFLYHPITDSFFELASHAGNEYPDKLVSLTFGNLPSVHEAARQGNLEVALYYLHRQNLYVDSRDEQAWTPLHHAAANGQLAMVNLLLENGASPDSLSVFSKARQQMLRRYGLTPAEPDNEKPENQSQEEPKTPLDLAREAGHEEIAETLQAALDKQKQN